ncbi:GNAT family N-acetyltransferase [Qipengyuania marisflavi]|uniref:GNAT family N-acetyltransferase n=1 Tax=Qipengyuania marisflavi TaxID=2486356 RepID=A0A5S3P9U9_9SPHN|nr:GNAT family N-acetyltransferase [Qipengyuania marisflavi]TMM50302.1 GNAT family N-acetyltransferase [Qipengyuania marisflavi]
MTDALDALMAVMEASFDPHWREAWTRRQVADSLCMPHTYTILAGEDGGPWREEEPAAGFVLARRAPGEVELLLVAVRPELRGRGIGQALIERFFQSARESNADRVFLEMRAGNPAERLYCELGFQPIGTRKDYYRALDGTLIDAITFGKVFKSD